MPPHSIDGDDAVVSAPNDGAALPVSRWGDWMIVV